MKKISLLLVLFFVAACSQAENTASAKTEAQPATTQDEHAGHDHGPVTKEVLPPGNDFKAGIHYSVLNPAWDTETDDIVVYEFFGYLCPHCYSFQPYMKAFEQRNDGKVKVIRVPVVFQPIWKIYAQAFYTADNMGILEKTHEAFFEAIHQHKKQFRTIEQIADWYSSSFGVDKAQFLSTANSFMIDGMIRKGDQMMRQMQIQSTPTIVVNGKLKPNGKQLRSREDMMKVVDYLVGLESQESM